MPSTSTSAPPLITLVTRASTTMPRLRFSQLASTADPLRRRIWTPSPGSKRSTTTSMAEPAAGISSPSNCSTGKTPSLLPPRSTKMDLAPDADHRAGPETWTAFLAALVRRIGHALGSRPAL